MSSSPNWTEQEIEVLKEAYPKLGKCKELAELFPYRSLPAITLKANRVGLKVINNIRKGRTNEEYASLLENTNFITLEEYKGTTVPIRHMCCICDYEWNTRPQAVLRKGAHCPICDDIWRKDTASANMKNVLKLANIEQLSPYTGALNPIKLRHTYCGYEWDTVYSYIQQGSGCPVCNVGFGYSHSGSNMPEVASIYLFKIYTKEATFLKIGVTARTVHKRQVELKSKIPNLIEIELLHENKDSGSNILKKEKLVLTTFKKYSHCSNFDGSTELLDVSTNIERIIKIMNENI